MANGGAYTVCRTAARDSTSPLSGGVWGHAPMKICFSEFDSGVN